MKDRKGPAACGIAARTAYSFREKNTGAWMGAAVAVLTAMLALGCSRKATQPEPKEAVVKKKPAPRFYYDLGPAVIDASSYPERQREGYKLFLSVCSACHTTARPLNAPYANEDTWRRFVRRMHGKMEAQAILMSPQEEERILEFLVYDSKVRKLDRRGEFQAQQEKLKAEFEESSKR